MADQPARCGMREVGDEMGDNARSSGEGSGARSEGGRCFAGVLLSGAVFVASLIWLGSGIQVGAGGDDTPPFHVDEAHKIGEAFYYHLFFEQRDLKHPDWSDDFYARTNPPVGKYILGGVLAAAGHPVRDHQLQTDFDHMWEKPEELRRQVPDAMLRVTRGTSVVFGAGIFALLFFIGYRVAGWAAGLIAVVLCLGNPSFAVTARQGLTDTILLFHLLLIVPVTMWAAAVLRRYWHGQLAGGAVRRWTLLAVTTVLVPALVIALSTGSKLNGSLAGPAYAAGLVGAAILCAGCGAVWRRLALVALTVSLTAVGAVAIFVAMNPYFHQEPISRMTEMMDIWGDWMVAQQVSPGAGLFTMHQKISATGYYSLRHASLLLPRLMEWVGFVAVGKGLMALGFASGLVYLVGRCVPGRRAAAEAETHVDASTEARRVDSALVLSWILICTAGVTLWLPVLWDRHLLPPQLTVLLTTAIGLATLPAGVCSVVRLFLDRFELRRSFRVLGGLVLVAGLAMVLAFTPWVIDPMLLPDPIVCDDVELEADSYLLHHNLGVIMLHMRMDKPAAERFESSLAALERDVENSQRVLIERSRILADLAQARVGIGDYAGGIEALQQRISSLKTLRDSTKTDDAFVRWAFDCRIDASRTELARLTQD